MKILTSALSILLPFVMMGQMKNQPKTITPPKTILSAFQKDFPDKKAKWKLEEANYEVEFQINGVNSSAVYDKKGVRITLEIAIAFNQLPSTSLKYLKKNYPTNKVTETAKITDDKNAILYEAEILKNGQPYDILFDVNGQFIKIEKGD